MKETFIIAENAIRVSVPEGLPAWEAIAARYRIFAAAGAVQPVLEVDVRVGDLPASAGERIYEPVHGGIDIVEGHASRLDDGSVVMEFKSCEESHRRLWMRMPAELDRAEIVLAPGGDEDDSYFLTHALMVAYLLASSHTGTVIIHSSVVVYQGRAYLFQGRSGTGKSTHSSLWLANIAGTELLNDDNPAIRFSTDGVATVYGTPWSGKTPCYRNVAAPIGAFVRIVRAPDNELRRLDPLRAYASLTPSVFFVPFVSDALRAMRHNTVERLAMSVPCYEMHCRPDADAALTCMHGVSGVGEM